MKGKTMTTKKQELTKEEQSQVMQSAEEFVRDLNYSELYELALENITNEYLSRSKDYLLECGWIRKQQEVA
jgi:uncharacterized membrane-anchored protein